MGSASGGTVGSATGGTVGSATPPGGGPPGTGVTRRRLLRLGAVAGLTALVSACGAPRPGAGPTTTSEVGPSTTGPSTTMAPATTAPETTATSAPTTTAPTTSTTMVPPTEADWKVLADRLSGRLSRPGSPGYHVDLQLYDPCFDSVHPAAVAFCASASDVARSIAFAREHGLALTARSGGHSYAGYSTTTGLIVDVSRMSAIRMANGVATVGAGTRLTDVYSGLAALGVSVPAGSCPTVGIAGLALGGGIGVMDRLHGLTSDSIVGLTLVTAAGDIVEADAVTNADLYWACRGGGGGNFGVVTEFRFATFPTTDVVLFSATWPWSAAVTLVPAWMEWSSSAPDELWSNCVVEASPGAATPYLQVGGAWAGGAADAQAQLAKLVSVVGPASGQSMGESGFEDAMYIEAGCSGMSETACHLAGKYPGGTLPRMVGLAKSDIYNAPLGEAGVRALLAGVEERQGQGGPGGVVLDSWGGAINRVAPGATAFVHRRALASAQYVADFPAGVAGPAVRAAATWMSSWYASLRPYVGGEAYQNYIDPALADWPHAYYGANLARLERIKAKWDPDGVWRFAQSIPMPSPSATPAPLPSPPNARAQSSRRRA